MSHIIQKVHNKISRKKSDTAAQLIVMNKGQAKPLCVCMFVCARVCVAVGIFFL